MYLGIDLGTSAVKALLLARDGSVVAQADSPLEVSRPHALWSEQDPETWWNAVNDAVSQIRQAKPDALAAVRAVGLSGQMHGATLLDADDTVLRPAILWNDGRSGEECTELEAAVPDARTLTGNIAMPGFTAPKLLWVRKHEPEVFEKVAKVLLPKDYVRLRMTGDYVSDKSDSAGTLWLDVAGRDWSDTMLEACGLDRSHMPALVEGSESSGILRGEVASAWGMDAVPVAGGGGDNAAGAVGVGVVQPGQAFLSLGTSGVYFVASDTYRPNPDGAVHTFCHALPDAWHQMAVILSAASCLSWVTALTGAESEASLLEEVEAAQSQGNASGDRTLFLPYLSGERTPHNDPHAKGVFFGMGHNTNRADLAKAVLEGVAYAFADGQDALLAAGTTIDEVTVIGGGARSRFWGEIIASVLNRPLTYRSGGELGPAFGAARLARLAVTGEPVEEVCTMPPIAEVVEPNEAWRGRYTDGLQTYRRIYRDLKDAFSATTT